MPEIVECDPTDDRFLSWRQACIDVLDQLIGPTHELRRQFAATRFRLHPSLVERKGSELAGAVGMPVQIDWHHFYRERVYEAQEILITVELNARTSSSDQSKAID